ncbi:MAG TPA: decarboxylating NADP(+)-dependent phosphogluconate dehydrogenase [Thermoanaerobaculia bacterium]|nr:decarboxylating NADP(+)-dependent phosphogluconate dehydrogenase [Thermoanaerobaculia bacterium]
MAKAQFGMIGLAVMGENLALNVADHGFPIAVWNREVAVVDKFVEKNTKDGKRSITGTKTLEDFVKALERPRKIMMMIKAGAPVDQTIDRLIPLLEEGDIIIDGGNSWFRETQDRTKRLEPKKLHFCGSGVSGGEEGARYGPSLMPGGSKHCWDSLRPIFESIAAKSDSGPCVTHVGPDGAGHFVKMVHNGIEYGDMQLIAETYDLLRRGLGASADELAGIFTEWNKGVLESFLIEITANIFRVKDKESGSPLVEKVLDKAGQKGTGKWTAQVALDLGISIPTIAASIDARVLSSMKDERLMAAKLLGGDPPFPKPSDKKQFIQDVHDALYASKICSYAQGMALIQAASREYKWNIDMKEMARIWKGGCIIRARFLDSIMQAYERKRDLPNLILDEKFRSDVKAAEPSWRRAISYAVSSGIAVPSMGASVAYYDSYRTASLPQSLTQAQRDYFGAHTYQRNDKGADAPFIHTEWH